MTYEDAKVIALMRAHYLAARVDQDADPALSERYGDYVSFAKTIQRLDDGRATCERGEQCPLYSPCWVPRLSLITLRHCIFISSRGVTRRRVVGQNSIAAVSPRNADR